MMTRNKVRRSFPRLVTREYDLSLDGPLFKEKPARAIVFVGDGPGPKICLFQIVEVGYEILVRHVSIVLRGAMAPKTCVVVRWVDG